MSDLTKARNIVTAKGDATGRISGINHLQLVVNDLDESIKFYRDLLGLKVVRTIGIEDNAQYAKKLGMADFPILRNYFVDVGNGNMISLIQLKEPSTPDQSIYVEGLWPKGGKAPRVPRKMDHLAFNVPTYDDLTWFRARLVAAGVKVSEVTKHNNYHEDMPAGFVDSIYFYDPSGIPLEIATFNWGHPKWAGHKPEHWLNDPDPLPSVLPT